MIKETTHAAGLDPGTPNPNREPALFIPLKRKFWEQFRDGHKATEYRQAGPRWNARTCRPGRAVCLAVGYSGPRLYGHVAHYEESAEPTHSAAWRECFGDAKGLAACISITLDADQPHAEGLGTLGA